MARKNQHPAIGKYIAKHEHHETDGSGYMLDELYATPEDALQSELRAFDEGDVIYVYAVVGVKVVRKPTLAENLPA